MSQNLALFLNGPELRSEARFQNMAVFPLFSENGSGTSYLSLDEALELRLIKVTEVSESGEVPNSIGDQ